MEIELADAVTQLRDELTRAVARGAGQDITFQVGTIELEFAVELHLDAKAKGGFRAWVLSGEGEAGVARGRTHRVTVTLTPTASSGTVLIHGSRPRRPEPDEALDRIED